MSEVVGENRVTIRLSQSEARVLRAHLSSSTKPELRELHAQLDTILDNRTTGYLSDDNGI